MGVPQPGYEITQRPDRKLGLVPDTCFHNLEG